MGCPSGLDLVIGALTDLKPVTSEKKNQNFLLQISKKYVYNLWLYNQSFWMQFLVSVVMFPTKISISYGEFIANI